MDEPALRASAKPGHWGLKGMRERAESMGARFDVWSRAQAGTEIELMVPARLAYGPTHSRSPWWRRWRSSLSESREGS